MFLMKDGWGERMWVEVTDVRKRRIVGTLRNLPVGIPRLLPGDKIKFKRDHIIGIRWGDEDSDQLAADEEEQDTQVICDGCNCQGEPEQQTEP